MECGHEEMEYFTMQLRSADEGQTVSSCLTVITTRGWTMIARLVSQWLTVSLCLV